ncbi:MAG: putative membrane protein [uncultured archaeon A07HR67]|nr:MAG: putative membrane protein [uncultured archaeon A07HR67]
MTETTWLAVVLVAAGAQLAVLPGEKVQLLIAGLSTRYRPAVVVSAAAAAFAGWTVLEIRFGRAITAALPGIYLDALTAALFVVFRVPARPERPRSRRHGAGGDRRLDD